MIAGMFLTMHHNMNPSKKRQRLDFRSPMDRGRGPIWNSIANFRKWEFQDKCLGGFALIALIFGLLLPDKPISDFVWAARFSDFMASIVPQIDRLTALGIRSENTRLYYSVLWACSPPLFAAR